MIFSRCFDGLGHLIQEKEYGETVFLINWETMCFLITDDNSDSLYSLNKIILDFSPVFFGLVEAGKSQSGSGAHPR
jgi:hypothetical protein